MDSPGQTLDDRSTEAPAAGGRTRYESDHYTWVQEQVALLRSGRTEALDLANIAEELNDVGLSDYYRLQSAIEIVLLHMIKRDQQPGKRSRSWALGIAEHRERALMQLQKSPGLKSSREEVREGAFRLARLGAARQMKRRPQTVPAECPYTWDEIMNRPFPFDSDR